MSSKYEVNLTKKQIFFLLGAGLVASGIVTILLIFQILSMNNMLIYPPLARHDHVSISTLVNCRLAVIPE